MKGEITIGNQVWQSENLDVDKFRNGDPISEAKTYEEWKLAGKNKQPAWCYYDNQPINGLKYGKLYNWYAVNDKRGLAPIGWHIPSNAEWTTLFDYLGGKNEAGKRMKSPTGWSDYETEVKSSGFNGLPGGVRHPQAGFRNITHNCEFWSSTNDLEFTESVFFIDLNIYDDIYTNHCSADSGLYVRCLKD